MNTQKKVNIVTDLGFGDAGKGSLIDYLARKENALTVVRFNGGPQAGHNVVTPEGIHHCFHQFGSASFVPNSRTHLSRFMLVSPLRLWNEAIELGNKGVSDAIFRVTIDENARIISPYQEAANRIREALRGKNRHGSCGLGIGETVADSLIGDDIVLKAKDLTNPSIALRKLELLREMKIAELGPRFEEIKDCKEITKDIESLLDPLLSQTVLGFYQNFCKHVRIVPEDYLDYLLDKYNHVSFEGAQGVLLDEWYGFHPYTTWSTTTNANAELLLDEAGYENEVTRYGLIRAFSTRHGAGPFVTEDARLSIELNDQYNPYNDWQQKFRVGHLDYVMTRYALSVAGQIDKLVVSNIDRLIGQNNVRVCDSYINKKSVKIDNINRSLTPDLDYQAKITEELFKCKPILKTFQNKKFGPKDIDLYLENIENNLDIPVGIMSKGQTALDKYLR